MEKRKGLLSAAFALLYLLLGSLFYMVVEGWSSVDSFYFTAMTVTTVGYGDIVPHTPAGKIFTVFYAFLGISVVFYYLGVLGKHYVEQEESRLVRIMSRALKTDVEKELEKEREKER